ncbi:type VII secretion protein EccCb [Mycobacterium sp. 852002-40037_SCH5390672]|uniref:type VII secretion protein EccCb n=1 Tax=Mycobacterium sp. 852002-40037_SCH5390672 TaxID=1834089 RepID=UPI000804E98A|nr:type VII secretion protein EccCb [Mycobacterium sp. 852002-40037_SCH5390672]OBB95152.1 type VII secretion protein EccCb [Mycobacterium sp. 852002-40037_SCH5390672]
MTQAFVSAVPQVPAEDIVVDAPPELPSPESPGMLPRLVPVVLSLVCMGVMAAVFTAGTGAARNPMFLAFPAMMLVSTVVTGLTARTRRHGGGIDADRDQYLEYLSRLSQPVSEIAVAQHMSSVRSHPDPDTLWTLIGGPRMWERRPTDVNFGLVRVGMGTQPLARRLVAPRLPPEELRDPVTAAALRNFLHTHSAIHAAATIGLGAGTLVTIDGDPAEVRGLLRAVVCQLAVLHAPDHVLIAAAIDEENRAYWDWLKWLPHNQHPVHTDEAGPVRMIYSGAAEARHALAAVQGPEVVVITDLAEGLDPIIGATGIGVGTGCDGAPLKITTPAHPASGLRPDRMAPIDALICARRLAGHHARTACSAPSGPNWQEMAGLSDLDRFDPVTVWRRRGHRDRLRVPIGTTVEGVPLELDIKEPAEDGMGPHGLCIGATGSGKSELLRTIALGMMTHNSPEALNLLLVDFKGGATFSDYAHAPHVSAVITNLADDAPLVARMRDALAGEMNRRQQLLRTAACASVAAYQRVRGVGAAPLPTLFIIVDEFSELLSQHPDFADMFVAIGRLGRSLGMHLLLASQRLDEGRLRGLEAHLSYRICLKTLSAAESQAVLGNLDAYRLAGTPGAGFLRISGGEPIRFQAALVSAPLPANTPSRAPAVTARSVRVFSTRVTGAVTRAADVSGTPERTISHAVLDRLGGQGPFAHRVWLPPLGSAPALRTVLADAGCMPGNLTVPIGIIDRPFDQCRTPLMVDMSGAAGNVAVIGAPQSGKSTTLCTLITALAATHDPGQVQFYCLDFGGGALSTVDALPHVGAVAGRAEPRLVARMVAECESLVRRREALFREHGIASIAQYRQRRMNNDPFGDVFLVIDGWAGVRQGFETLEESITALAAQGLSFGVHVVLSASRWAEVRPSLRDQIGTRVELRLGDAADSEIDRKAAQHVPRDSPGRGLSREGLHMVIALPIAEVPAGESIAPPIPQLPMQVDREAIEIAVRGSNAESGTPILLGLRERELRPMAIDFGSHSHLLVLGDNECGKTATLRTLCREIVRTKTPMQARLLIVDFRRALLGVVESEHLSGYAMSPAALAVLLPELIESLRARMPPPDATQAQLRSGVWWSGPELFVVVDDYDLVATPTGNALAPVVEFLPYAADLGLHLVIARRSGGVERAMFEPLLASLHDLGCMSLLMSGCPAEGGSFGSTRPMRLPPGRGVLSTRAGAEELVQVAWSPP